MTPMLIMLREPDGSHRMITLAQAYWHVHAHYRVPRGECAFSSERRNPRTPEPASDSDRPSGNSTG